MWGFTSATTEYAWANRNVQHFIHSDKSKFDLIISEQFYQESWLTFAHKYKAPIITISTYGGGDTIDHFMGLRTPLSFVTHPYLIYSAKMTFFERCMNILVSLVDSIGRKLYYMPLQRNQANKYMGHLNTENDPMPSLEDLEQEVSLTLLNTHKVFDSPRPKMPGQIEIGGINLNKKSKPLPNDIKQFLDEAKEGVIYFSWGSVIKSSQAPKELIRNFLAVFKRLQGYRILWKWEDDITLKYDNIPENIMTRKWMPQKEVLEHPNVILFITHGGLFGSSEALYNGVPMLFTPFFGDQHRNAERAARQGYARSLPFSIINATLLNDNIREMLKNDSYSKAAKAKSLIFRDNLNDPMQEAIYWIEYVVRHNGAKFLKSYSVNLNFFQYYSLDVFAFVIAVIIISSILFFILLDKLCKSKTKNSVDKKKTSKKQKKN